VLLVLFVAVAVPVVRRIKRAHRNLSHPQPVAKPSSIF
jgi:hypothetical protein